MNMIFLEDDLIIRTSYTTFLKIYFKEVYEVSNGIEGLIILENNKIDFILTDINMDEMDGIEFIKKVRKINKNVFIVIMSAYDDKKYLFDAIKLDIFDYIVKPVKYSTFQNLILDIVKKIKKDNVKEKILNLNNGYFWHRLEKKLFFDECEIKLTNNERLLFQEFCLENERIFTLEELFELLYPLDNYNENKVRMIIKRLKNKIKNSDILINMHNIGYKFNI